MHLLLLLVMLLLLLFLMSMMLGHFDDAMMANKLLFLLIGIQIEPRYVFTFCFRWVIEWYLVCHCYYDNRRVS